MNSRHTSSVPEEDDILPRLLYSDLRCSQVCRQHSQLFSGLSSARPDLSLALQGLSLAVPGASRFVVSAPRCSPGCHQASYVHRKSLPRLPGAPEGHSISPVHSGIRPWWDSSPTISRHSQRLPETQTHFADDIIQTVERNVLCDGHQPGTIGQSVAKSFSHSKQPLR